jgi:hypothetical protein
MTFLKGRVLLAYCAGDKKVGGLNRLKVVSLPMELLSDMTGIHAPQSANTKL